MYTIYIYIPLPFYLNQASAVSAAMSLMFRKWPRLVAEYKPGTSRIYISQAIQLSVCGISS